MGSDGHKLLGLVDQNPIILGTRNRVVNVQEGLTSSNGFGYMTTSVFNVGSANYNGLVSSLTKRLGDVRGLGNMFFTASYTWSHNISNVDGVLRTSSTVPAYNWNQFRGNDDFDIRNRFVLSGGWELPFSHMALKLPKALTGGWSLYPIFQWQSGRPVDVRAGLRQSNTTAGPSGAGDSQLVRPNDHGPIAMLDPHNVSTINGVTGNFWFDPTNLNVPAVWKGATYVPTASQITYGSLGRNAIPGPGRVNLDLSIEKKFNLFGEHVHGALRGEFFNILNHTEFSGINTSLSSGLLGQATSTYDPRIVQLALRFDF